MAGRDLVPLPDMCVVSILRLAFPFSAYCKIANTAAGGQITGKGKTLPTTAQQNAPRPSFGLIMTHKLWSSLLPCKSQTYVGHKVTRKNSITGEAA